MQWEARQIMKPNFLAISKASKYSLLRGSHTWTIHNDSQDCSESEIHVRNLTLTGCSENEFTCGTGACISMEKRCDSVEDCEYGSDELDCKKVYRPPGYNNFLIPVTDKGRSSVRVNVSVDIEDILDIDELKEKFVIKFTFKRDWFDNRLVFLNLKEFSTDLNKIEPKEWNELWYPSIDINNIESEKKFKATSIKNIKKVIPNSNFTYKMSLIEYEQNSQVFKGSDNAITLSKQWSVEFICHYNTAKYPFDTQICKMEFVEGFNGMYLHPSDLSFNKDISLNSYFVREVAMCRTVAAEKQAIVVEVTLGRPLVSNILTVFIPTTILMFISYMARVFEEDYLDMVLQVNLTVLLVQATL